MTLSPYAAPGIIHPTKITIEIVTEVVCKHFGCDTSTVHRNSRKPEVIDVRNTAIYLCRSTLHKTYAEIGAYFVKDHATIINSCKRVENRLDTEPEFKETMKQLIEKINLKRLRL